MTSILNMRPATLLLLALVLSSPAFGQQPPVVVSVTSTQPSGTSAVFTLKVSDNAGYQNIPVVDLLINNFLNGIQACYVAIIPSGSSNASVYLVDDLGDSGGPYAGSFVLSGPVGLTRRTANALFSRRGVPFPAAAMF